MNQASPHHQRPILAKVLAGLAWLTAIGGLYIAFWPLGFGFFTVFTTVIGVIFAGMSTRNGGGQLALWAARANFVPIVAYAIFMALHIPSTEYTDTFKVNVVETGVLENQLVFPKKLRSSGPIQGVRMTALPCGQEFVVHVTGNPNTHLGVYVPTDETRECLSKLTTGTQIDMQITTAKSVLLGEIKDFRIQKLGDCAFEGADNGAVVKGLACPEWRRK